MTGPGPVAAPKAFSDLFDKSNERHECGDRAGLAYVSGYCHVLAAAVQEISGGDIVMLSPYGEPESPEHFGVVKDGVVTDAYGHFTVAQWIAEWSDRFHGRDYEACLASRTLVEEITSKWNHARPIDAETLTAAAPLAQALVEASHLPSSIWQVEPSRRVVADSEVPRSADEAWSIATARPNKPDRAAVLPMPQPTLQEMSGSRIAYEDRVVDANGRFAKRDHAATPRDPRPSHQELWTYAEVRRQQAKPHPNGRPSHHAFSSGRCHILAVAIQEKMGGELVMLVSPDKPNELVHAAVHIDGTIIDAWGHHDSGSWAETWKAMNLDWGLEGRITTREQLSAMMQDTDRRIDEAELSLAKPLAEAIGNAGDLPKDAWRACLPGIDESDGRTRPRPAAAWAEAMAKPPLPHVANLIFKKVTATAPTGKLLETASAMRRGDGRHPTQSKGPIRTDHGLDTPPLPIKDRGGR